MLWFFVSGMLLVGGTSVFAAERLHETGYYLGTDVSATLCYGTGQKQKASLAMQAVWQKFAGAHAHMNMFDPRSDVSVLNASSGRAVKVHDDVYGLVKKSKEYWVMTHGVFDVTVEPLTALWRKAGQKGEIPSTRDIQKARKAVGADRIVIAGRGRIRVPSGMKIDLGGCAAGFVADQAADVFRTAGFGDFLIDAGGEIYAGGESCEGRPWRIGINDPEGKGKLADVVELKDRALSTSGSYEKYVQINGERWPHIVNPVTGYPERGVVSATVIAPYAADADILSTALCVLGPGPGFKLVEDLGKGYAAMVITENETGTLEEKATPGYAVYRKR